MFITDTENCLDLCMHVCMCKQSKKGVGTKHTYSDRERDLYTYLSEMTQSKILFTLKSPERDISLKIRDFSHLREYMYNNGRYLILK